MTTSAMFDADRGQRECSLLCHKILGSGPAGHDEMRSMRRGRDCVASCWEALQEGGQLIDHDRCGELPRLFGQVSWVPDHHDRQMRAQALTGGSRDSRHRARSRAIWESVLFVCVAIVVLSICARV